jgi:hypothetical protein
MLNPGRRGAAGRDSEATGGLGHRQQQGSCRLARLLGLRACPALKDAASHSTQAAALLRGFALYSVVKIRIAFIGLVLHADDNSRIVSWGNAPCITSSSGGGAIGSGDVEEGFGGDWRPYPGTHAGLVGRRTWDLALALAPGVEGTIVMRDRTRLGQRSTVCRQKALAKYPSNINDASPLRAIGEAQGKIRARANVTSET